MLEPLPLRARRGEGGLAGVWGGLLSVAWKPEFARLDGREERKLERGMGG